MVEWRLGLTVLKLGNRYRCCQLQMFANEVARSFVVRQGTQCNNMSKDVCHALMTFNKHIQPIFPQLVSLVVFQSSEISDDSRDILLYLVANGSSLRQFFWGFFTGQDHQARSFFDWLFRCSVNLNSFTATNATVDNGFELTYEHTIIGGYVSHQSITYLRMNVLNITTLRVLFHYLPQLQHLGNYYRM
jgi:hypothetical protein